MNSEKRNGRPMRGGQPWSDASEASAYRTARSCAACFEDLDDDAPHYATLCKPCFIAAKKREQQDLLDQIDELIAENERLRDGSIVLPTAPVLRFLLQRAHPDLNDGSALAGEATKWLLALRAGLRPQGCVIGGRHV